MKRKIVFALIAFFVLSLSFCKGQSHKETPLAIKQSITSKEKAINIFKEIVHKEPIYCIVKKIDDKDFIFCMANKTGPQNKANKTHYAFYENPESIYFYILTKFENNWKVEVQKQGFKPEEYSYIEFLPPFAIDTINKIPYMYFLYNSTAMGNGAGGYTALCFTLISLVDFQKTELIYSGENSTTDKKGNLISISEGEFSNLEELSDKPYLKTYLENKANTSSYIYKPTAEEMDIDSFKNHEKMGGRQSRNIKCLGIKRKCLCLLLSS